MTLNGVMANSVAFRVHYVKWLKIHRHILRVKCSPMNPVFSGISFMAISAGNHLPVMALT